MSRKPPIKITTPMIKRATMAVIRSMFIHPLKKRLERQYSFYWKTNFLSI